MKPHGTAAVDAQIKAQVRPAPTPPWNKGIMAINAERYYNAIECGKQGGDNRATRIDPAVALRGD